MPDLKSKVKAILFGKTLEARRELFAITLDELFYILSAHKPFKYGSDVQEGARIMLQMLFSKALSINKLLEGQNYEYKGIKLNTIIDPTPIAVLARNIYEMIATFHLIYVFPKTKEEQLILYSLWRISGLSYRQKFVNSAKSKESQQKFNEEKDEIDHFIKLIEKTNCYQSLPPREQGKIHTFINEKEFKITIESGIVNKLSWQGVSPKMGLPNAYFEEMYTYFSLYAHPSYVSVWHFSTIFDKDNQDFLGMTKFNLDTTNQLLSIFIADYLKYFPELLPAFEKQDSFTQIVINFFNKAIRGVGYTINHEYNKLEE